MASKVTSWMVRSGRGEGVSTLPAMQFLPQLQ